MLKIVSDSKWDIHKKNSISMLLWTKTLNSCQFGEKKNPHIVYDIYLLLRLHIDSSVIWMLYVCLCMKARREEKNQNQDKLFFSSNLHSCSHAPNFRHLCTHIYIAWWCAFSGFNQCEMYLLPIQDILYAVSKWLCFSFILFHSRLKRKRSIVHCTFNFTFHVCFSNA